MTLIATNQNKDPRMPLMRADGLVHLAPVYPRVSATSAAKFVLSHFDICFEQRAFFRG
ncbi:MAG: hypothetical protein ACM3U2_23460 [Deltaproteobacteria bacterium]